MASPKRRQRLLQQVTRLREIEHRAAATAAAHGMAEAEAARRLAQRAGALAAGGALLADNAQELAARLLSGTKLHAIAAETARHAAASGERAEARLAAERQARRRLERTQEASAQVARFLNSPATDNRGLS